MVKVHCDFFAFCHEDAAELGIPFDLIRLIGRPAVNGLHECLVHSRKEHKELALTLTQIMGCKTVERTIRVDRVHDRPSEREERYFMAFEVQVVELACASTSPLFKPAEDHFHLELNDLVGTRIGHPE